MAIYKCTICGYEYNEDLGDPEQEIKPGTPFTEILESWHCPLCFAPKEAFVKVDPEHGDINQSALFSISYGLYCVSSHDGKKDNACIINSCIQLTDEPKRVLISLNNGSYTNQIIKEKGLFNVSVLNQNVDFSLIKKFGYASGKNTDKVQNFEDLNRSKNGLIYLNKVANAFISCKVEKIYDVGSHSIFVGLVTEAQKVNDEHSLTYEYYQKNIKNK